MAAMCRGSYDVDSEHAEKLLDSSEDVAVIIECVIRLYDSTPQNVPLYLKRLLDRDRRLSHSLESLLSQRIQQHHIAAIWNMYRPGFKWVQLASPNDCWIITKTKAEAGQESLHVQLNFLQGELLINGIPLGRLPQNYVNDPDETYSRILGQVSKTLPCGDPLFTSTVRNRWMSFLQICQA
jgi:hypothetical protein